MTIGVSLSLVAAPAALAALTGDHRGPAMTAHILGGPMVHGIADDDRGAFPIRPGRLDPAKGDAAAGRYVRSPIKPYGHRAIRSRAEVLRQMTDEPGPSVGPVPGAVPVAVAMALR